MGIYKPKTARNFWGSFQKDKRRLYFDLGIAYSEDHNTRQRAEIAFEQGKALRSHGMESPYFGDKNYFGFKKNKKRLESWLKRKYGLGLNEYRNMARKQMFKCEICGQFKTLCVDHCHTTGKIRGLLCKTCNSGIGLLKDNRRYLLNAIEYLNNG